MADVAVKLAHQDMWVDIVRYCDSEDWLNLYLTGDRTVQQLLSLVVKSDGQRPRIEAGGLISVPNNHKSRYYPLLGKLDGLEELWLHHRHAVLIPSRLQLPAKLHTLTLEVNSWSSEHICNLPTTVTKLSLISSIASEQDLARFPVQLVQLHLHCHYRSTLSYQLDSSAEHDRTALQSLIITGLSPGNGKQQSAISQLLAASPSLTQLNISCRLSTLDAIKDPTSISRLELMVDQDYVTIAINALLGRFRTAAVILHCTGAMHHIHFDKSPCDPSHYISEINSKGNHSSFTANLSGSLTLPRRLTTLDLHYTGNGGHFEAQAPQLQLLTKLKLMGYHSITVPASVTDLEVTRGTGSWSQLVTFPPSGRYRRLSGISIIDLLQLVPVQLAELQELTCTCYHYHQGILELLASVNPGLRKLDVAWWSSQATQDFEVPPISQLIAVVQAAAGFPWLSSLKLGLADPREVPWSPRNYHQVTAVVILPELLEELSLNCYASFVQLVLPPNLRQLTLIHTDLSNGQLPQLAQLPLQSLFWHSIHNTGKIRELLEQLPDTLTIIYIRDYVDSTMSVRSVFQGDEVAFLDAYWMGHQRHLQTLNYNYYHKAAMGSPPATY